MARRIIGGLATVALALGLLGLGSMQRVTTQDRRFDPTRAELESLRRENDALRKQLRQSQTLGRGCSASTTVAPLTTLAPSAIVAAAATGRSYVYSPSNIPYASNDLVMMTYATGGVAEMLRNWVRHVERVKTQGILVAAMDHAVTAQCTEQRFDCLDWSTTAVEKDTQYVRGDFAGFRALGVRKLDALLAVLSRGVHVVLSDVDCVWSASPEALVRGHTPGFQAFADADVLVATDCMSPELDASGDGCYNELMDKNTGVLAVRATADGIATMREWRQRIALAQKDEQDQTTFMDLMDSNGRGHRWGMDATARREWAAFASTWCKSAGFSRARSTRGIYQKLAPKGGGGGAVRAPAALWEDPFSKSVCPTSRQRSRWGFSRSPRWLVGTLSSSSSCRRPAHAGRWPSMQRTNTVTRRISRSGSGSASVIGACGLQTNRARWWEMGSI